MAKSDNYIIPSSPINLTKNDVKILIELVDKELEDKSDIVRYGQCLFLKRKLEECDKMLSYKNYV